MILKPKMGIFAPINTRSGYGDMSRDLVRHFIEYDKFDVFVISAPWGDTPMNALDASRPEDKIILDRIVQGFAAQPEVFVHIGIPSEAKAIGKFNILCTAGIETNAVSPQWIEASNQMDVVFVISEHSKNGFTMTKYQKKDTRTGQTDVIELTKPIEVLHNCINTEIFGKNAPKDTTLEKYLDKNLKNDFNFLFVGHWLRGDFGEDRKNVALLVKIFLEVFKQVNGNQPGLILKTSSAGFSIIDREEILNKIEQVKKSITLEPGQTMPNVYLLHGELTDKEMNTLYNHSKVKVHISLTKGEGFGRPLLEASVSGKPVIASGWSGHMDFLNKDDAVLVGGELKQIHESSVWENVLIKEASWFAPDHNQVANAMVVVFRDYTEFKNKAYNLAVKNRKAFSYETIRNRTFALLDKYVPEFPTQVIPTLPKLKKIPKLDTQEVTS